ncbi:MAG: xanthine dehydrogenase family protein molybdopterin-binding subunit [Alphaproteobacteria bacterium]
MSAHTPKTVTAERGDPPTRWIGQRIIRPDGADKVTGRADFGADLMLPGMLTGRVLRSPHPHARLVHIDTTRAAALPGVKAVVTGADFPDPDDGLVDGGEAAIQTRDLARNVMARDKVLYEGHAVAAVAATSPAIAEQALGLIQVTYDVLPHVIDVEEAMAPDAPILHEDLFTRGIKPKPQTPSNVARTMTLELGDIDKGFAEADIVLERTFRTAPVHQAYIEPHAAVAEWTGDGQSRLWCSSQGHFMVRALTAKLLKLDEADIRVVPAEIGGGFGGKTTVYLEPVALLLSRKAGRPVRMVMSRQDVFTGTGPTSGGVVRTKIGARKDGTITAGHVELKYQAGAFPGSPMGPGCMAAFACYDLKNVRVVGYDVVSNRPKCAAYRAPGAPISAFAVESVIDELSETLGIDPIDLRLKNVARKGTRTAYGPTFSDIGMEETLQAAKARAHYSAPLGPNQGRGVACGFWFNIGGQSSAIININPDGTAVVVSPNPDIGGSRASLALMAAEVLGIPVDRVRPIIGDTASIPYSDLTGGSRVTFAIGMAVIEAAKDIVDQLRARAARLWDVDVDGIEWRDGAAHPASTNVGVFDPLSLGDLAAKAGETGGPISGKATINAKGAGPGFGTHICDVEVDPETGRVDVIRYTAVQDAGRAIHPSYVEGQMQGGVAQGIGWALNEAYLYGPDGRLENPAFLDYRIPVASDLPMIDTVIVEVPNPEHPYGVRGVGEVPIVPPLGAVANAVSHAIGQRMTDLPLSPPRVLAAITG